MSELGHEPQDIVTVSIKRGEGFSYVDFTREDGSVHRAVIDDKLLEGLYQALNENNSCMILQPWPTAGDGTIQPIPLMKTGATMPSELNEAMLKALYSGYKYHLAVDSMMEDLEGGEAVRVENHKLSLRYYEEWKAWTLKAVELRQAQIWPAD